MDPDIRRLRPAGWTVAVIAERARHVEASELVGAVLVRPSRAHGDDVGEGRPLPVVRPARHLVARAVDEDLGNWRRRLANAEDLRPVREAHAEVGDIRNQNAVAPGLEPRGRHPRCGGEDGGCSRADIADRRRRAARIGRRQRKRLLEEVFSRRDPNVDGDGRFLLPQPVARGEKLFRRPHVDRPHARGGEGVLLGGWQSAFARAELLRCRRPSVNGLRPDADSRCRKQQRNHSRFHFQNLETSLGLDDVCHAVHNLLQTAHAVILPLLPAESQAGTLRCQSARHFVF